MTVPAATELAALVQRARVLLLDFDGPICSIFAGHPAPLVAQELVAALSEGGETVPAEIRGSSDPFDVLRFAATLGDEVAGRTEAQLRAAEVAAVTTAQPTPRAEAVIGAWRSSERPVAVVSNNSEAAVAAYVARRGLQLDLVVGRTCFDPSLLKPNSHLLIRALAGLGAGALECVLVGDSPSDVAAGREAGVPTIGFANKSGKRARLQGAGANFVIDDLNDLWRTLQTVD